jgi:hypothetical protein
MKKGKYIDIYVVMACMSRKKSKLNLHRVDEMLKKACNNYEVPLKKSFNKNLPVVLEETLQ